MFLLPNFGAVGTKHRTQHDNNKITRTRVWNRKYDLSESKNTRLQSSSCFVIIFHSKVDKATWILCKKRSCLPTQNSILYLLCKRLYKLNITYLYMFLQLWCNISHVYHFRMFIPQHCSSQDHWSGEGGGATVHDATHHCRPMDASSCFSDKTELYCHLALKVR